MREEGREEIVAIGWVGRGRRGKNEAISRACFLPTVRESGPASALLAPLRRVLRATIQCPVPSGRYMLAQRGSRTDQSDSKGINKNQANPHTEASGSGPTRPSILPLLQLRGLSFWPESLLFSRDGMGEFFTGSVSFSGRLS